jgi:allantoin racemase
MSVGADTIVLGCVSMALLGVADRLSAELGTPVVNPGRTALKTAELLLGSDLTHSKRAFPVLPKISARTAAVVLTPLHESEH